MGRPPIGERAMTPAEKQRRYRARKFGNVSGVTKPTAARGTDWARGIDWEASKRAAKDERRARRATAGTATSAAVMPETEAVARLEKQLRAARTEIKNLKAKVRGIAATATTRTRMVLPKRLYREIRGLLHPDRAAGDPALQRRLDKCLAEFNGLKVQLVESD